MAPLIKERMSPFPWVVGYKNASDTKIGKSAGLHNYIHHSRCKSSQQIIMAPFQVNSLWPELNVAFSLDFFPEKKSDKTFRGCKISSRFDVKFTTWVTQNPRPFVDSITPVVHGKNVQYLIEKGKIAIFFYGFWAEPKFLCQKCR